MAEMTLGQLAAKIGEEAAVKIAVEKLGMTEDYARFTIALEQGKIKGDVVELKPGEKPKDIP